MTSRTVAPPAARVDRVGGALFGQAAGDRIGGPTAMSLRLLESVVHSRRFSVDDVRRRYVGWHRDRGFDQGPTAARVLDLLLKGEDPERAVATADREAGGVTAGCNPMHRATLLGAALAIADGGLDAAARSDAGITHAHPLAGDAATAGARCLRALVCGETWENAVALAARDRSPEIARALSLWREPPHDRGGFAPVVLHAAAHFAGTAASFEAALKRALAFAGPSNYAPVTAGAFAGARFGHAAIDPARIAPIHDRGELDRMAAKLSEPA